MSHPTNFAQRNATCLAAAVLLIAGAFTSASRAGDWTTVGGNSQRNGLSDESGPVDTVWEWEGTSSALFAGQIYIEGNTLVTWRFQSINVAPIVAHDLETGDLLWSRDFKGANSRSVVRGFRDGQIYATNFQETGADTLYALDPATGNTIWKSTAFCERGITWSIAFADDGDLFIPGVANKIVRVERTNGTVVWERPRIIPNTGAEGLCVFGNTIYGFEGSIVTPKTLTAWDLATGVKKYSSATLPGDGDQEMPHSIGPDGTIYVLRDGGLLHALEDTGAAIVQKWSRAIAGTPVWGQFGVEADGSPLVPDGQRLLRLDAASGVTLDQSPPLVSSSWFVPRVTIDVGGKIYVGNGASGDGALYALAPDLSILWQVAAPNITYSGPALASGGKLAVAGGGTFLSVYGTTAVAVDEAAGAGAGSRTEIVAWPNPFGDVVTLEVGEGAGMQLGVFDINGRMVRRLERPSAGRSVTWNSLDSRGQPVAPGVYLVRAQDRSTAPLKLLRLAD